MNYKLLFSAFLALSLTACATSNGSKSYVAKEITQTDAEVLAADAVNHLSSPLPPAHTTFLILSPSAGEIDLLTPTLVKKLRERGYGVHETQAETETPAGTKLRYLASPFDNGLILRLQYLQSEATRFYQRNPDNSISPGAPFTVRVGGSLNEK